MTIYLDSLDLNPLNDHTTTTEKPNKEIITKKLVTTMTVVAICKVAILLML